MQVKDEVEDQQENEGGVGPQGEDDTPWTALASVALFKLFNDWQVISHHPTKKDNLVVVFSIHHTHLL